VPVGGPLVGGGMIGSAGGVGDAVGDPGVNGAIGEDVGGAATGGSCPSHDAHSNIEMPTNVEMMDLRKRNAPAGRDDDEDTHSSDPW
jgi:hypothetical protein